MMATIIVIGSVVLAAVFTIAYLTRPGLRRQIEHPKYCFQDQVQHHNRQCHDAGEDVDGGSDESR